MPGVRNEKKEKGKGKKGSVAGEEKKMREAATEFLKDMGRAAKSHSGHAGLFAVRNIRLLLARPLVRALARLR
jgi:hypothetical protein